MFIFYCAIATGIILNEVIVIQSFSLSQYRNHCVCSLSIEMIFLNLIEHALSVWDT